MENRHMGDALGIEMINIGEGVVTATMPVDHRTCQPWGYLNGGASLALAEMMAGFGSQPLCAPDEIPCGIQVSANHVGMVRTGCKVTGTAHLVHRGKTLHVWNVDIKAPDGRLVSTARITNQILKKRQEEGHEE